MELLTRSPTLVHDVGNRLCVEVTDHKVSSIGKYGHGGGKIDRWWEQKAVKSMSTCEHRSQTSQPRQILPMFDLSSSDDSPTQSRITTRPWYKKWERYRTWTNTVQPRRLQRLRHETVVWGQKQGVVYMKILVWSTAWKCCVGKRVKNSWTAETTYSRKEGLGNRCWPQW